MQRRVVVTGLGAITPLGVGAHSTWARLLAGHSGLGTIEALEPRSRWADLPSTVAGLVPRATTPKTASSAADCDSHRAGHEKDLWCANDWISATQQRRMSLFTQYAVAAGELALRDAGWRPTSQPERDDTGVCLGTGIGNLDEMYDTSVAFAEGGYRKVSPIFVPRLLSNMAAGHLAMLHGLRGPNHTATTACTTGAHSIGDAARFIAHGSANAMLAGGSEACIHPLAVAGFARARSLSTAHNQDPLASCAPFDATRSGFVIAEGAAVLLLEELDHAFARGARIYAEVRGYGCSADAHHMTAPREDGSGALLAMKRALRDAGLRPADVDYINAHATGTRVGDAAEARAVRALMLGEDGVDEERTVALSSTKGATGHLLGAAGAVEAIFSILAVAENVVPPTLNLTRPDVGIDFNFVPLEAQQRKVDAALTNSFGFGGTNCSLVFSKID